jgi:hypothetical protein
MYPFVSFSRRRYNSGLAWYFVINVPGIVLATAVPNPDRAEHRFIIITEGKITIKSIEVANVSNPNRYVAFIPIFRINGSWINIANIHAEIIKSIMFHTMFYKFKYIL